MKRFIITIFIAVLLVACSSNNNNKTTENNNDTSNVENNVVNKDNFLNDNIENENNENSDDREEFSPGDNVELEARVELSEENNELTVEGITNLLTNTSLTADLIGNPMGNRDYIDRDIHLDVQADGSFQTSFDLDDDFFQENNGQLLLFSISYDPLESVADEEIKEVYGKDGENLKGPFVQINESVQERNVVYAYEYLVVGSNKTTYIIESDDNKEVPGDYGETEIWAEAEITGNDHYHIYVEGSSNILEGTQLLGRYFSDQDKAMSQNLIPSLIEVDKYGDFIVPIRYDSITDDGYVELTSYGSHRTKETTNEVYGEKYENITGNIVEDNLSKDGQIIRITVDYEGMDVEAPDESLVTEEDGELKIAMPDDILFDFDKSSLKSEAKDTLKEVSNLLKDVKDNENIQIKGHTDNEGNPEYNQILSEERAEAVAKRLRANEDLKHLNFIIEGYGETKPVASNDSEDGRKMNRRVEIVFHGLELKKD